MEQELKHLLEGCRLDKREQQQRLFERYLPYVTSICRRYLRDQSLLKDAVQECFLSVFRSLQQSYDAEKGPFKPWLRKIAINASLRLNMRFRSFSELKLEYLEFAAPEIPPTTDDQLLLLINSIPGQARDVFNLHIIDGYSHAEIADLLGISADNSRKKLQRAREYLKQQLDGAGDERKQFLKQTTTVK